MLRCPTAAAPISRGTHLARLASGWAECAGCPHAAELAGASPTLRRRLERRPRGERPDPFGGVAGADFSPEEAGALAARFAATLPPRAAVVLGRDERATHAPFLPVVAAVLRHAGCDVLHLGEALEPTIRFAVRKTGAAGGLWLAAPDRPAGHAGLIPLAAGGRPLTDAEAAAVLSNEPRIDRQTGIERGCGAAAEHEASLWPAFRTLSALRIRLASPSTAVRTRFDRLFAALPDDLRTVAVSPDAHSGDLLETMRESLGDIRLFVDSSSARCREFAADGTPVPWTETVRTLAADAVRRASKKPAAPTVALAAELADDLRLKIAAAGGRVREVEDTPAALWTAVEDGCTLAAGTADRAVFATPHGPAADAALVLAALLRSAATAPGHRAR
ncbi:phosphohexomutase domain-containing protein [Alienimonas californiensis]|uniref:Phosphoglucomutase/phosphomannomutase, alpha/beta/alpha domain I n=1 Tax=Alienimonas californiensis TaxID=2527989 RepID=A0A517PEH4_9PLAN|nr:hypothetical protein [Alienimonas californiensis]QDT17775.1 Phosphoglucomutase/phosphomannomutase, alpha/beta/alpha domain I [Alienimonas californiensis]